MVMSKIQKASREFSAYELAEMATKKMVEMQGLQGRFDVYAQTTWSSVTLTDGSIHPVLLLTISDPDEQDS
jgi:hypothetical protein